MKYWAFISYSHTDSRLAARLHRAIESYRFPANIIGQETAVGIVPKRLWPIFRDREELPTSADLGRQIRDALEQSRTLIVICSPRSAQSQWVQREILEFKQLGRATRIFCVIADGEPNAASKPAPCGAECFAEALRYEVSAEGAITSVPVEPIAADLRPGKDSMHDAVLKIVAGVAGVGFDALRQRDLQRQRQWSARIAAMALFLIATFASIAAYAVKAQQEAERQRAAAVSKSTEAEAARRRAERITSFMFDTLKSPDPLTYGRDVTVVDVLNNAIAILDDRGRFETATRADQETKAWLLNAIGQSLCNLGQYQDAVPPLRTALQLMESAHSDTPTSDTGSGVSTCSTSLGSALRQLGDLEAAELLLNNSLNYWEASEGPRGRNVATALSNLALVKGDKGHPVLEKQMLARALGILESDPDTHPFELADSLSNLAFACRELAEYDEAERLLLRAYEIDKATVGDAHPRAAHRLSGLMAVYGSTGKNEQALKVSKELVEICEKGFGSGHPRTAGALNDAAQINSKLGNWNEAEAAYQRAYEIFIATYGDSHTASLTCLSNLGEIATSKGDLRRASELSETILLGHKKTHGDLHPTVAQALCNLAASCMKLSSTVATPAEAEELCTRAEQHCREALRINESVYGTDHPSVARALEGIVASKEALRVMRSERGIESIGLQETKDMLDRAIAIYTATGGEDCHDVAGCLHALSGIHFSEENFGESERLLARAIAIREKQYGGNNDLAIDTHHMQQELGLIYTLDHKLSEAYEILERSAEAAGRQFGADNPVTIAARTSLALCLRDMGKDDEACNLLNEVITWHDMCETPILAERGNALLMLAKALAALQRRDEAAAAAVRGLADMAKAYGDDAQMTKKCAAILCRLYRDMGKPDAATSVAEQYGIEESP